MTANKFYAIINNVDQNEGTYLRRAMAFTSNASIRELNENDGTQITNTHTRPSFTHTFCIFRPRHTKCVREREKESAASVGA